MYTQRADVLRRTIEDELPAHAREHFARVLYSAGEEDAKRLVCRIPNSLSSLVVVWLYFRLRAGDCSPGCFRAALNETWNDDHDDLIATVNNRRILASMFRHAQFPAPPSILTGQIAIWRGTFNISPSKARRGLSWTTERDCACWFALRFGMPRPLVLKAMVPVADLFHLPNDRKECEVVWFGAGGAVDGDLNDWNAAAVRWRDAARPDYLQMIAANPI